MEEIERRGENTSLTAELIADPDQKKKRTALFLRILVLLCIGFLYFGFLWALNIPLGITVFDGNFSFEQYNFLSSIVSNVSTFVGIFGGLIADQIPGVHIASLIFTVLILAGHTMFYFGVHSDSYPLAVFGRLIYAIGGPSIQVIQLSFTVKWFEGKNLSSAIGVVVGLNQLFNGLSFLTDYFRQRINKETGENKYSQSNTETELKNGIIMCVISFLICVILTSVDVYVDRSSMRYLTKSKGAKRNPRNFSKISRIPKEAWILMILSLFFLLPMYVEQSFRFSGDYFTQNIYNTIPSFVGAVCAPIFGLIISKTGRNISWIFCASLLMTISSSIFLVLLLDQEIYHHDDFDSVQETDKNKTYFQLIFLGISSSMGQVSIYSLLSFIVPRETLSAAFGAMISVQNLGYSFFSLFYLVFSGSEDGLWVSVSFVSSEILVFFFGYWLMKLDKTVCQNRLNATASDNLENIEQIRINSSNSFFYYFLLFFLLFVLLYVIFVVQYNINVFYSIIN